MFNINYKHIDVEVDRDFPPVTRARIITIIKTFFSSYLNNMVHNHNAILIQYLCVLNRSVVSNSSWPLPGTILAHQAPLSMGILQARILEWIAMSSSRVPSWPRSATLQADSLLSGLSHQGSPRILEWVAYPVSKGSSWPKNQTRSPVLQVDSLQAELPGKPQFNTCSHFLTDHILWQIALLKQKWPLTNKPNNSSTAVVRKTLDLQSGDPTLLLTVWP